MKVRTRSALCALGATLLLGGCVGSDADEERARLESAQQQAEPAQPAPPPPSDVELEVDLAARELHVYRAGQRVATHPVAVGSREWPTPTGEWTIGQVIFNPRWIPPEEAWAKDEDVAEPGDPDNPLGAAQLVYRAPNSIHGTDEPESLGQAVSHGSIRVANDVVIQLARQVMEAGGAARDDAWFQNATQNNRVRQEVNIPSPVPIRVVERSTRSDAGSAADSAGSR